MEIIRNTPIPIYLLFITLLCLSIRACFSREIKPGHTLILPLIFALLSLTSFRNYSQPALNLLTWTAAALAGALLSRYLSQRIRIVTGSQPHTLRVSGMPSTLIIMLLYFSLRYYLGYQEAVHGALSEILQRLLFGSSGFSTGFFAFRAYWLYQHRR